MPNAEPDPVLIVGSVALDTIETPAGTLNEGLGGSAMYASLACSLMAPVRLVGVVGEDYPSEGTELLRSRGVDLRGLEVVEGGQTFRWTGRYAGSLGSAETLSTELNVFADFSPSLPPEYADSPYVFLANIQPQLQARVLEQVRTPRLAMCDTMNLWLDTVPDQVADMVRRVDVALMNDAEARQLTGEPHLIAAARKARAMGANCAVIKKGEHGALICTEAGCRFVPPFPTTKVVDTTGAGDSFAGGMIGYLAQTGDASADNITRAAAVGTVVASFSVEALGVRALAAATMDDVKERYAVLEKSSRIPAL